jgi:hypothetical protein
MKSRFSFLLLLVAGPCALAAPTAWPVSAKNYTVRLAVTGQHTVPAYGENSAPDGRQFLLLDAEFTDVIDSAFATERGLPDGAKNDNLAESLTLVIDGETSIPVATREADTAHLDPEDSDIVGRSGGSTDAAYLRKVVGLKNAAGKRSLVYYDLARPGASVRGELVFEVPTTIATARSLELRYHDPVGSDLSLMLSGTRSAGSATARPPDPAGMQTNEVLAVAARIVDGPVQAENPPPPGRRYVAVEFQARSLLKVQDQYPAYDSTHAAGEMWWRPDPVGWVEFHDSVQLIADGALPCGLERESDVPAEPEFPARSWGRYRLVYLVPEKARSLDLACYFPDYTIPGHDEAVTPKPMHFHLAGPPAVAPGAAKPEKRIMDGALEFSVTGHRLTGELAGEKAAEGEQFLLVDFIVRNTGQEVGRFIVAEQCSWFNQGQENSPDDISSRGPHAPPATFPLGPGEARAFQVAWRVPVGLKKLEMGLKGNVVAEKFTLPAATP